MLHFNRITFCVSFLVSCFLLGTLSCNGTKDVIYNAPDWFTDRGNLGHTASTNATISLPLSERWRINLDGGVRSSIIGSFNRLYVGADDEFMYSLNPQDGSVLWKFKADDKISSTGTGVGENKDKDTYLWFIAEDGKLYALDARNGNLLWTVPGGIGTFNSSTNYATGIIYYAYMSSGGSSKTRAVNGTTGEIIWDSDPFNITTATPMHGTGKLFQGMTQGGTTLQVYNPQNGDIDWDMLDAPGLGQAAYTSGVLDTDVGLGNKIRVYIGVRSNSIRAVEAHGGEIIWETELSGSGHVKGLALTQNRDTNTLIVSQRADLYALEPSTGSIIWRTTHSGNLIDGTTRNTPKPAIYGDFVFHVENGLELVARSLSSGSVAWSVELDAPTVSSPTVGGNTVYIATNSGAVYAFSP